MDFTIAEEDFKDGMLIKIKVRSLAILLHYEYLCRFKGKRSRKFKPSEKIVKKAFLSFFHDM